MYPMNSERSFHEKVKVGQARILSYEGGRHPLTIYEKEEALAMLKAYALCQEIRTKKQVQMRLLRNQTPMEARLSCEGLGPLVISKANERDVGAQGLHRGSCFVALVRILARR
jgi:hypothetical protein